MIPDEAALRAYLGRILGWSSGERAQAIEQALRSIHLALTFRSVLVLLGDPYLVPVAQALHRLTLGHEPFVMCDPRRGNTGASARVPMNRASGVDALRAAVGGSLCLHEPRMPRDLPPRADHRPRVGKLRAAPVPVPPVADLASTSEHWRRMWCHFTLRAEEFRAHYHRRSNVESTLWMIKSKFGAAVRSKLPVAQVNKILAKIVCHNLACIVRAIAEFGIDVDLGSPAAPSSIPAPTLVWP